MAHSERELIGPDLDKQPRRAAQDRLLHALVPSPSRSVLAARHRAHARVWGCGTVSPGASSPHSSCTSSNPSVQLPPLSEAVSNYVLLDARLDIISPTSWLVWNTMAAASASRTRTVLQLIGQCLVCIEHSCDSVSTESFSHWVTGDSVFARPTPTMFEPVWLPPLSNAILKLNPVLLECSLWHHLPNFLSQSDAI